MNLKVSSMILSKAKYIPKWREENPGKIKPGITDGDPLGRRIAMAIEHLRQLKNESNSHSSNDKLG